MTTPAPAPPALPDAAARRAAVPPLDGAVTLPGLHRDVQVWRDAWGIPHARAADEHDAWFAQGFVTAQDRLWAMEYDRRRAVGRWAEVAGKNGAWPRPANAPPPPGGRRPRRL